MSWRPQPPASSLPPVLTAYEHALSAGSYLVPAACRASVRPLLPECLLGSREHARGWSLSHGSHVPPESLHAEEGGAKWTSAPPPHRAPGGPGVGSRSCLWAGGQSWTGLFLFPWHVPGAQWGGPLAAHGCQGLPNTTALGGWVLMPDSRAFRRISITVKIRCVEKTLESPLDCKEIQPVHPKGNQS